MLKYGKNNTEFEFCSHFIRIDSFNVIYFCIFKIKIKTFCPFVYFQYSLAFQIFL